MLRILWFVLLLGWLVGIFIVSLLPNPSTTALGLVALNTNPLHLLAFFGLFVLTYLTIARKDHHALVFAWLFTILVSFLKELAQLFTATRVFSWEDLLLDFLAALAGFIMVILFRLFQTWIKLLPGLFKIRNNKR